MAVVNQESVFAACDSIVARGERVTGERVRIELGTMFSNEKDGKPIGSPNDVHKFLNLWKAAQKAKHGQKQNSDDNEEAAAETEQAADNSADEQDAEIAHALSQLSSVIVSSRKQLIRAERADAAAQIDIIRESSARDLSIAHAAADARIAEIQAIAKQEADDAQIAQLEATGRIVDLEEINDKISAAHTEQGVLYNNAINERNAAKEQVSALVEKLAAAQENNQRLTAEVAALNEEATFLNSVAANLKAAEITSNVQRDSALAEVERLRPLESEAISQRQRADDFERRLEKLTADNTALQASFNEARHSLSMLNRDHDETLLTLETVNTQLNRVTSLFTEVENDIATLQKKHSEEQKRAEIAERLAINSHRDCEERRATINKLSAKIEKLEDAAVALNDAHKADIATIRAEYGRMIESLEYALSTVQPEPNDDESSNSRRP